METGEEIRLFCSGHHPLPKRCLFTEVQTMAQNWYVAEGRHKLGPFSPSQLRQLVATGRVQPTTMVLREGTQRWVQSGSIKGLFLPIPDHRPAVPLPPREAPPPLTPVPAQSDILGAAKGMMKSVAKLIGAKGQEAAALARRVAEAKAGSRVQRATTRQPTNTVPSPSKWRFLPWLAGAFGLFFLMSLCVSLALVGLGIRSVSQMAWNNGGASSNELQLLKGHTGSVNSLTLSSDGRYALSSSGEGVDYLREKPTDPFVRCWDLATGKQVQQLHPPGVTLAAAISPDGKRALTGSGGIMILWDLDTGREVRRFDHMTTDSFRIGNVPITQHRPGVVHAVGFPPDTGHALSASFDFRLKGDAGTMEGFTRIGVWDLQTGEEVRRFEIPGQNPMAHAPMARLTPDCRQVLCNPLVKGPEGAIIRVWDVEAGQEAAVLQGHTGTVSTVRTAADNRHALSYSKVDNTIKVWDLQSRTALFSCAGPKSKDISTALSPDGRRVLCGGDDGLVLLLDAATGKELARFSGHVGAVCCLAFTPDGGRAVSGGKDKTIRLWKLP
jgi:WD40 repeat protein